MKQQSKDECERIKKLRMDLAMQELRRAATRECEWSFPAVHFPAVVHMVHLSIEASPIVVGPQMPVIESVLSSCDKAALSIMSREDLLAGACINRDLRWYGRLLAAYMVMSHLACGARLAGGALFWIGANLSNHFAAAMSGEFPNAAELLIDALNPDKDSPVPAHLYNDSQGG